MLHYLSVRSSEWYPLKSDWSGVLATRRGYFCCFLSQQGRWLGLPSLRMLASSLSCVPRSPCPELSGGSRLPAFITLFPAFCLSQAFSPLSQTGPEMDVRNENSTYHSGILKTSNSEHNSLNPTSLRDLRLSVLRLSLHQRSYPATLHARWVKRTVFP